VRQRGEKSLVVVALGGNAILQRGQKGTAEEQLENVRQTARSIVALIRQGYDVVITHGNGPQVGIILLQNEEASRVVPPMPLYVCGAESQGLIGLFIQQCLGNELTRSGVDRRVATVVTQVVVSPRDPAFERPTKPIGPFYDQETAQRLMRERNWVVKEDSGRGWRRVVPSPDPLSIKERAIIAALVREGYIVVASGGGGVPVIEKENGELAGVEAVIDKDLAAECLARDVGADTLLILTDVERIKLNYGEPDEIDLVREPAGRLREYQKEGHFKAGSMGPKVEALLRFVEGGGRQAIVAHLSAAEAALRGEAGTTVFCPPRWTDR